MSEKTNLHWSFNHDRKEQGQSPDFAQQFCSLVEGTLATTVSGDRGGEVTRYTILPNFRRGYKGPADGDDLSVGEVVIRRTVGGENRLNYSVVYRNAASGELMDMQFTSNRDAFRTLTGTWSVQVENCAGDGYKEFSCDGRLEEDGSTTCCAIAQLGKANSGILGCTSRIRRNADTVLVGATTDAKKKGLADE